MSALLENKNVVIVIFAREYTRLHKALTAQGGHNKKTVTRTTDLVVSNGTPCPELARARALGVRIITQHDFEALLEGTPLPPLEPEPEPVATIEAFGQARSVLHGDAMSTIKWRDLVALIDACEPEALDNLTQYIEHFIAHGERESTWSAHFAQEPFDTDAFRFFGRTPADWYAGLLGGERSSKYGLIREIDLLNTGLPSTSLAKMLDHPDLARLRRVCLARERVPTKGLIKRLCEGASTAHIELLGLCALTANVVDYFGIYGLEPRQLTSLDLTRLELPSADRSSANELIVSLLKLPYFSTLRTLCLPWFHSHDRTVELLDALFDEHMSSAITHLHIGHGHYTPWRHISEQILAHPGVRRQVMRLSCSMQWRGSPDQRKEFKTFCSTAYPGRLELLDLSGMRPGPLYHHVESWREDAIISIASALLDHLPGSRVLDSVDALGLGPWTTGALCDALTAKHPLLKII